MSLAKYGKMAYKKYPAIRKRARVYVPAVRQLASDVMYLKGLINSEPKVHGVESSNNFNYNGVIVSLCDVPTGDTTDSRDGDRLLPRYLNIKFHVNRAISGASSAHTTVRYIIFRWWGENPSSIGVNPSPSDILYSVGGQFAPLSQLKTNVTGSKGDRNRRIEVHRTGMITLDSVSKTAFDEDINITLNGGKKPKEHMEYFSSTTAPPTSGGFFIMFISDNSVSTDQSYYLRSVLTFYDN